MRYSSGAAVNSNQRVYVIAVEGSFTVIHSGLNSHGYAHVRALTFVLDARTGRETDGGFSDAFPDLARLGRVRNLLPFLRRS